MFRNYRINNLNLTKETNTGIRVITAQLEEFNQLDDVQTFLFDADSSMGSRILEHHPQYVLKLDPEDFEVGELEVLDSDKTIEVLMHKDYVKRRRGINRFNYLDFYKLDKQSRKEIPFVLYEHMYEYYLENGDLVDLHAHQTIAIVKKQVPIALIDRTDQILQKIYYLLRQGGTIEELKDVVEIDLKRTGFGEKKGGLTSEGYPVSYFETTLKSYSQAEQKILFFSLVEDPERRNSTFKTTKGFWNLFLFICLSIADKSECYVHLNNSSYIEVPIRDLLILFEVGSNFAISFISY